MTGRPPLWTPEEARADAEREGERQESVGEEVAGCFGEGCLTLLPTFCLVLGLVLLLR